MYVVCKLNLNLIIDLNPVLCFRKLAVLSALQLVKVEGVKFEASFMSEQATLFLSSIGLLGGYCPKSRKKNRHSAAKVVCMHLGLVESYRVHCLGCQFICPFPFTRNFTSKRNISDR